MADESPPDPAFPEDRYQDPNFHLIGCVCVFGLMTLLMIIYVKIVLKPVEMDPKRIGLWLGSLLVQVKITLEDTLSPEDQCHLRDAFDQAPAGQEGESLLEGASHERDVDMHVDDRYQALWNMMHHWYRWSFCMVTPYNQEMWHLLMYAEKGNPQEMFVKSEDGPAEGQWSWLETKSRFFMSYISNGLYKAIIVYTLPLWLSRGGLTDFVLNAFATVYIVDLDDLSSKVHWSLVPKTEYLKSRSKSRLTQTLPNDTGSAPAQAGRSTTYSSEASTAATAAAAEAGAAA
eukprot:s3595_g4.t1